MKVLSGILTIFILVTGFAHAARTNEIVPNCNLVTEGIPQIPASLAEKVNLYKNGYGYPLAGWDPNKRELWLKILASTGTWVYRIEAPESISKPLISTPMGGVYDLYYQPQGKYLVYNKDNVGDEFFQLYLYDIATREIKMLTDGKSRNTEPVWSNAGDRIIYRSSPPNGNGVYLSIINPFSPQSNRPIAQGKGHYLKAFDRSPDDRKVVFCDFASNTVSTLWIIDVASGEKALLTTKRSNEGEYYDFPQFSQDGKGIYVITDRDSEFRKLAYVNLATREYLYLSDQIKWDVEDFKLSSDGKSLAFVTDEHGGLEGIITLEGLLEEIVG